MGIFRQDQPVLAADRVRYLGDPVVAVAGKTEKDAARALDLIDVEYEELPAVFDPVRALEAVWIEDGRTLNRGLMDYALPTALDVPPIEFSHVDGRDDVGPFGAKCVGEPALVPTTPVILNAIYDAVGVRIYDLPATPERFCARWMQTQRRA